MSNQIIYRAAKGSELTWLEEDGNFRYLNTKINAAIADITPFPSVVTIAMGGTNSPTALNNNRFIISSGGKIVESAALTINRAVITNSNGLPAVSATTATELAYVSGVTSAIQTQIDGKYDIPTGTTSEYIRGDGSINTFPTGLPPGGSAGGDLTGTYPNPLIGVNKVTYAKFQQVAARSIVGNPTATALANAQTITAGTDFNILRRSGTTIAFGSINLAESGAVGSSILLGANGGTGVANTGKTITIGGNFAMSGAFTFTGTLTGNTAVTFPTTGTLATTSGVSALYVPYTDATRSVTLGSNSITARSFIISGATSGTATINVPAIAGTTVLTFPASSGTSGYVLSTDGSGVLSWVSNAASQWITSGSNIYYTTGNVSIGTTQSSAPLTISSNSGTLPTPPSGTMLHIVGANATEVGITYGSYGFSSSVNGIRTNGTLASPTTLLVDNPIISIKALGYDGTAYSSGSRGKIDILSAATWAPGDQSTYIRFLTTAIGSTTLIEQLRISDVGVITATNLAGSGTRTVVASATGVLSTIATPTASQWTTDANGITYGAVSGDVGIGQASSATYKLAVTGATGLTGNVSLISSVGSWGFSGTTNAVIQSMSSNAQLLYQINNTYTTAGNSASSYFGVISGGVGFEVNSFNANYTQASNLDIPSTTWLASKTVNWSLDSGTFNLYASDGGAKVFYVNSTGFGSLTNYSGFFYDKSGGASFLSFEDNSTTNSFYQGSGLTTASIDHNIYGDGNNYVDTVVYNSLFATTALRNSVVVRVGTKYSIDLINSSDFAIKHAGTTVLSIIGSALSMTGSIGASTGLFVPSGQVVSFDSGVSGSYTISKSGTALVFATGGTYTFTGNINVSADNGYLALNRSATNKFVGIDYQTAAAEQWFVGLRENLTSNNYVIYNASGSDAFTLEKATNNAIFAGTLTTAAPSGSAAQAVKFGSVTTVTAGGLTALGITRQWNINIGGTDYYLLMGTSAFA